MANVQLNFSAANSQQSYSLTCRNHSSVAWTFYVYQRAPQQESSQFSLAWFASPYKISPGSTITFTWELDYSFAWSNSGVLQPGVVFNAGGIIQADPNNKNQTIFSMDNNTPQLSPAISGGQQGALTVDIASNVPNNVFSTGIGMSGQPTFVSSALTNTRQIYSSLAPRYFIAAGNEVRMGEVLAENISLSGEVVFPANIYRMYATLDETNQWSISQNP